MATTEAEIIKEKKAVEEVQKDQLEVEVKEDVKNQEKGKEQEEVGKEEKEEEVKMEVEPNTGVKFPVMVSDGKQLDAMGIYGDHDKLKELLKSKFEKAPEEPTKELYEAVIDSDVGLMVRLVIVFPALTMNMVRKNFDETIGATIKKLNGGQKDDELAKRVMGDANDSIKLSSGSVIEITRLLGYTLQTRVKGEVISTVESELLCRAYFHLYLGDDPFDKNAKEKFGASLLSLSFRILIPDKQIEHEFSRKWPK